MRILALAMSFLALFAQGALAQTAYGEARRVISVAGSASLTAEPDMATITLGVTRRAGAADQALGEVAQVSQAVFDRLADFAIAPRDMQTSNLNLRPLYSDRPAASDAPARIVGYEASNRITIKVRKLDDLGAVLDQVAQVGANSFDGLYFSIAESDALQDQARIEAVADAMARAALLAQAAGVVLGPVLSISDQSGGGGGAIMPAMEFVRAAPMPVAGGELSISASVSMVFAIEE